MISALIFGRANGVWNEVLQARELAEYKYIIGVGSAGVDYPEPFDIWVSFHYELFPHWIEQRTRKGYQIPCGYWSNTFHGRGGIRKSKLAPVVAVNLVECSGGSSGLVAVRTAVGPLKCDRVVLAGIPMEAERGQYDSHVQWDEANKHRLYWIRDHPLIKDKVRSMSGWTAYFLGKPTKEWLAEESVAA